jgi:hypothetical protein
MTGSANPGQRPFGNDGSTRIALRSIRATLTRLPEKVRPRPGDQRGTQTPIEAASADRRIERGDMIAGPSGANLRPANVLIPDFQCRNWDRDYDVSSSVSRPQLAVQLPSRTRLDSRDRRLVTICVGRDLRYPRSIHRPDALENQFPDTSMRAEDENNPGGNSGSVMPMRQLQRERRAHEQFEAQNWSSFPRKYIDRATPSVQSAGKPKSVRSVGASRRLLWALENNDGKCLRVRGGGANAKTPRISGNDGTVVLNAHEFPAFCGVTVDQTFKRSGGCAGSAVAACRWIEADGQIVHPQSPN